ncbi:MAG: PDZ domain-containing protein [Saprospiraceae bacterium]|nr:PDZ domain-containing protein [Saprospiraceae bacterium]
MNKFLALILLLSVGKILIAQSSPMQSIQINIEGADLDTFNIVVKGNVVLINGLSADSAGVRLNMIRREKDNKSFVVVEDGLPYVNSQLNEGKIIPQKGWIGMITMESKGSVSVYLVEPKGPAERAGLSKGDVIKEVDNIIIKDQITLANYIKEKNAGDEVNLKVLRDNSLKNIVVVLSSDPKTNINNRNVEKTRRIENPNKPRELGVSLSKTGNGKLWEVIRIESHSPAEQAGLLVGDHVLSINNLVFKDEDDLSRIIKNAPNTKPITFKIKRDNKILFIKVD